MKKRWILQAFKVDSASHSACAVWTSSSPGSWHLYAHKTCPWTTSGFVSLKVRAFSNIENWTYMTRLWGLEYCRPDPVLAETPRPGGFIDLHQMHLCCSTFEHFAAVGHRSSFTNTWSIIRILCKKEFNALSPRITKYDDKQQKEIVTKASLACINYRLDLQGKLATLNTLLLMPD